MYLSAETHTHMRASVQSTSITNDCVFVHVCDVRNSPSSFPHFVVSVIFITHICCRWSLNVLFEYITIGTQTFQVPPCSCGGGICTTSPCFDRPTNKHRSRQRVTRFALKCAFRVAPLRAACTHTLATAASQPHFCLVHTTQHVHETFRQLCAPKSLVCCKPDSRAHSDFCILVVSSSVGVISDLQLHRNQILCISISI